MNTPRPSSTLRNVSALALVVVAAYFLPNVLNYLSDRMFFPWALARPPLLDRWVGELTAGNGDRLAVALMLERDLTDSGRVCVRCLQLEGFASTCDNRGVVRRYRLSGSPTDRDGRELRLGASPIPQPPPEGLELSTMHGHWDGGECARTRGRFHLAARRRGGQLDERSGEPAGVAPHGTAERRGPRRRVRGSPIAGRSSRSTRHDRRPSESAILVCTVETITGSGEVTMLSPVIET